MIILQTEKETFPISKHIYGQFAEHLGRCIYEGIYVGEDSDIDNVNGMRIDVVGALKELDIPVLRWPGGCFADEYHWKDGIGPKENRKTMVNTHWGGVTENNHFGTHEFFELVKQLGCEAYVNGNVGSGSVQEMAEWVEYMTMPGVSPMADLRRENGQEEPWDVSFFGVGNENWGCGGNMRPEYYSDLYRRYQTYVRQYGDKKIYKIAGGANVADYNWTETLMKNAHSMMDGLSLHYYVHPGGWESKGDAVDFTEDVWYLSCDKALYMDELITKHTAIMDIYDPEKNVDLIVDEWGAWYEVEKGTVPGFLYQQNTIRDAMIAAIHLNIFHKHGERVYMTNIAQMINVLQAMILTEGDKMIKTPTYHVFELYKNHKEGRFVEGFGDVPEHVTYTATTKNDVLTISLCNFDLTQDQTLEFSVGKFTAINSAQILNAESMDDHNTFEDPEKLKIIDYLGATINNHIVSVSLPAKSVLTLTLTK